MLGLRDGFVLALLFGISFHHIFFGFFQDLLSEFSQQQHLEELSLLERQQQQERGRMAAKNVNPWEIVKKVVPQMTKAKHKGQAGRIAVFGGSFEYTGAPYYAAISTLKAGGDLSWVVCTQSAGIPIKTYSPEIIVMPSLTGKDEDYQETEQLLNRIHALVIGPGLGRDPVTFSVIEKVIHSAKERKLPIVIDGDGLFLISQKPHLVGGYSNVILTPNVVEFKRLYKAVFNNSDPEPIDFTQFKNVKHGGWIPDEAHGKFSTIKLAKELGGLTILQKGQVDIISDGRNAIYGNSQGSPRRCGGQGDVLAGTSGLFYSWAQDAGVDSPGMFAALGASTLTRTAGWIAFQQHKRGMTTPDLIAHLGVASDQLFPVQLDGSL